MSEFVPTIGLEIHVELKTRTKMFCDSANDPDESGPNVNICPVCMGHPGTLPTINKEAVKHVLRVGVAVGGTLADRTSFDRKNYFYPDIPKGYQISQYQSPLVKGGSLNGIAITRIHLEEDTATSLHDKGDLPAGKAGYSLIDFNRAGVPLMEIVTEPVIHNAKTARDFARELQLLLRCLGVSNANMEKGEMRVEANISIAKSEQRTARNLGLNRSEGTVGRTGLQGKHVLGTKVEVKNLNSFKSVEKAIAYEIKRHTELLEKNEEVIQETRGWDDVKGATYSQRRKEESHDYRYFPDPDLPTLYVSQLPECTAEVLRRGMPELPSEKRKRYLSEFGLKSQDADTFITNPSLGAFFEVVAKKLKNKAAIKLAANYLISDLLGLCRQSNVDGNRTSFAFSANSFAELIEMLSKGELSSRAGKDILTVLFTGGGSPRLIAEERGLIQKNDEEALKRIVKEIIDANPKVAADYRGGKEASLQFLIGQGMKATKGGANPEVLKKLFTETLT